MPFLFLLEQLQLLEAQEEGERQRQRERERRREGGWVESPLCFYFCLCLISNNTSGDDDAYVCKCEGFEW